MSKIRLHGSSSGYMEIAPPAAGSSATITLPNSAGEILLSDGSAASLTQIPAANIVGVCTAGFERTGGFGQLLQTKHKASGAKVSTTATVNDNSFTTGAEVLSISITPTVATSVIHITGMLHFSHVSDYEGYWWLTYNHSGISESMIAGNSNTSLRRTGLANLGATNIQTTMQPNSSMDLFYDHNTTNEITFKVRMATSNSGKSMNFNRNPADSTDTADGGNPMSSITVMELSSATITDDTVYRGT